MQNPASTITQALTEAVANGLERLDAQLLLLHALGRGPEDRAWLLAHDHELLDTAAAAHFALSTQRRGTGESVAYIIGKQAFYGLSLQVDARVLVPRPDTETLVDWALEVGIGSTGNGDVLDLGTGSGAVALALQHVRPAWRVRATDVSQDALAVASGNARRLNLAVNFLHGSWFEALQVGNALLFDLIVSNPPYIAERDAHLPALRHEPAMALTSGPDGLDAIRQIISSAPAHLVPGGWLLLEHGFDQAARVRELLVQAGFCDVQSRCDLAGIERCSGGRVA